MRQSRRGGEGSAPTAPGGRLPAADATAAARRRTLSEAHLPEAYPGRVLRRRTLSAATVLAALAVAGCAAAQPVIPPTRTEAATPPAAPPGTPPAAPPASPSTPTPTPTPRFDRAARPIDDPTSVWVVVNRSRPLNPLDYVPADLVDVPVARTWNPLLRREASDAVVALFAAARAEAGLALASNSAYRSYATQMELYDPGNPLIAPPGTSEHQTGLAMDIGAESGTCSLDVCFANTPEGQWLTGNAWRFGFVLRFPDGMEAVTGYPFEPWHYRYVGVDLAAELTTTGTRTLEEFFGLPPAPPPQ